MNPSKCSERMCDGSGLRQAGGWHLLSPCYCAAGRQIARQMGAQPETWKPIQGGTWEQEPPYGPPIEGRRPIQIAPPSVYMGNGYYADADSPAGQDVLRARKQVAR